MLCDEMALHDIISHHNIQHLLYNTIQQCTLLYCILYNVHYILHTVSHRLYLAMLCQAALCCAVLCTQAPQVFCAHTTCHVHDRGNPRNARPHPATDALCRPSRIGSEGGAVKSLPVFAADLVARRAVPNTIKENGS